MKTTGSEVLLDALMGEGVDLLFGYPGGAIMPIYDALFSIKDKMHHVLVRHEQAAALAAIGYARASGQVGVCFATSGPGATNLITGIADAMMDSVPLVCITGQVPSHLLGSDAFQESDIIGMSVPVTKWNTQVTDAKEIPAVIRKAFQVARSGRPGPVLVDITKDAQTQCIDSGSLYALDYLEPEVMSTSQALSLENAATLLNAAKQPLVLIGHGVALSGAETALLKLAEKADLPVASTLHGLSCFPSKHRLFKGMVGMHGHYAANLLSNQADVVLAVGMRFDDRVTGDLDRYLTDASVIHVEIDAAEIDKHVCPAITLHMDAKLALDGLFNKVNKNEHARWHQAFEQAYAVEYKAVIKGSVFPSSGPIKMAEFMQILSDKTGGDAMLVTDVGQHQMIAARYYQFNRTRSHLTSGGLGTMGYSLPAAIGAQLAQPNRLIVSISGDGGIQMNIQELAVVAQERLPLKIVILDNQYLGMVRQQQELYFNKRYAYTDISSPDFVALAQSYGLEAARVSSRHALASSIEAMLASQSAYVLLVSVDQEENVFPIVPPGESISNTRLF